MKFSRCYVCKRYWDVEQMKKVTVPEKPENPDDTEDTEDPESPSVERYICPECEGVSQGVESNNIVVL